MLKTLCLSLHLCSAVSGPAYVVDGDTVRLGAVSVRLAGLDCEELGEPHGQEARAFLVSITAGRELTCTLTGARSHGRHIGRCTIAGADVAAALVAAGLCLDCARYSAGAYRAQEPDGARSRLMQKPYC
jgi:endonuclease YncB( thermonuclease family)